MEDSIGAEHIASLPLANVLPVLSAHQGLILTSACLP